MSHAFGVQNRKFDKPVCPLTLKPVKKGKCGQCSYWGALCDGPRKEVSEFYPLRGGK